MENKFLENKSGRIFCVRQVYKFLPINLYVCVQTNLFFFIYTKSEEKEYYDGGAVFIIQTSYKMQYFTIFQDKLHSFNTQDHRSTRGLLIIAKPFKKCPKSPTRPAGYNFWQAPNLRRNFKRHRKNAFILVSLVKN